MPCHSSPRISLSAGAALCTLLLGCGGNGSVAEAEARAFAAGTSPATVRVEGCVVDEHFIPNEGVAVRALSADGSTLAYATSGRRGEFVMHLPARAPAVLAVDREGGEWLQVAAQERDKVVESCLVARNAA